METFPTTLMEATRYFADPAKCDAYMERIKWPDGVICCPKCGNVAIGRIQSRRMYQCKAKECRKQFSAKVGTIFEDSPIGLDKWFVAIWSIVNAKNGISSCELARAIGVTQKTAWFMLHRVRLAMQTKSFRAITGEVEADETIIGGKAKWIHASVRAKKIKGAGFANNKTLVQGLRERGGEIRAQVIPNSREKAVIQKMVRDNVSLGSHVYTDKHKGYWGLNDAYVHQMVDHAVEYVVDRCHTNGLENFWALLKRSLGGTYVSVMPKHLDAYLDEQCLRYNLRKDCDAGRFETVASTIKGRRLTYANLTAQEDPA